MDNSSNLISLAMFKYTHRAHILQSLLSEAGIESSVTSSSVFRQIDSAKVLIKQEDLLKARQVLKDNIHEFSEDEIETL
ncbi:MAG: hypothetical protein ACLFM1_07530 [Bacteroidales bacterium]